MEKETKFMKEAIKEAKKALLIDEVPIGCVIVKDNKIIARGHNVRESKNSPIGHAEIEAINKASKKLKSWRLEGCDIYITLEPCIMCSGAIIQSRIENIYFGASDPKGGALISSINVLDAKNINHRPKVHEGILKEECSSLISDYFKNKREEKKKLGL
ncbi:MAG: tRNA adenosine(34) deaminase TadA [Bacilli bacterium]|nr:tRNA adenosine(34) deaminase TadA [Bacilli bacterium]